MLRNIFVYKIQCELSCPKWTRKSFGAFKKHTPVLNRILISYISYAKKLMTFQRWLDVIIKSKYEFKIRTRYSTRPAQFWIPWLSVRLDNIKQPFLEVALHWFLHPIITDVSGLSLSTTPIAPKQQFLSCFHTINLSSSSQYSHQQVLVLHLRYTIYATPTPRENVAKIRALLTCPVHDNDVTQYQNMSRNVSTQGRYLAFRVSTITSCFNYTITKQKVDKLLQYVLALFSLAGS